MGIAYRLTLGGVTVPPGASNTGASGTLSPLYGDQTITTPSTTLEDRDIYGKVAVQAANVTIRNCRIRGNATQSTNAGLVSAYYSSTSGLVIEDCTIAPDVPSVWWTGVLGHDYTATRCDVYYCVDGFGVYNTANSGGPANVTIEDCWIHDLSYIEPDPNHGDNRTHNDGIQIQGNSSIVIRGNTITANCADSVGTPTLSPYAPSVTGQAIGITPNVSAVTGVTIEGNWIDYGAQSITIIEGSKGTSTTATILNNRFGRNQPLLTKDGVSARRAIYYDSDLTLTTGGNVYDDDGSPVTIYSSPTAG